MSHVLYNSTEKFRSISEFKTEVHIDSRYLKLVLRKIFRFDFRVRSFFMDHMVHVTKVVEISMKFLSIYQLILSQHVSIQLIDN